MERAGGGSLGLREGQDNSMSGRKCDFPTALKNRRKLSCGDES